MIAPMRDYRPRSSYEFDNVPWSKAVARRAVCAMIGQEMRARYEPPQDLPHELLCFSRNCINENMNRPPQLGAPFSSRPYRQPRLIFAPDVELLDRGLSVGCVDQSHAARRRLEADHFPLGLTLMLIWQHPRK